MAGTDKAGLMTICSSWGWKLHNPGRIGVRNKWPIQTISVTFLFAVAMTGCVAVISRPEFGVNDQAAANKIDRVNELAALRNQGRFVELANHLEADLSKFSQNTYAVLRIRNELAEIYSYLLLDIERAIAIDEVIAKMPLSDMDAGGAFVPQFSVARQRILSDESYLNNYIKVSQSTISEAVKKRLETNKALMAGSVVNTETEYSLEFLRAHIARVANDVQSTPPGTVARKRLLSRLVRAEYELAKRTPAWKFQHYELFESGQLSPDTVDLTEIDFISLADYFSRVFRATGNITYAEHALGVVYRPYVNLRNSEARWKYNKLINRYITTLIDANFERKAFEESLYYISLNKSRMLLEERIALSHNSSNNSRLSEMTVKDGIPRTPNGLPEKAWYRKRLSETTRFLDFYVGGDFVIGHARDGYKGDRTDDSVMPLNSRNATGIELADSDVESFRDTALYISKVSSGRVTEVRKIENADLFALKDQLERSYRAITVKGGVSIAPQFQRLISAADTSDEFIVSPDKWVAKHPLDFHLGAKVVRTVNFFTSAPASRLATVQVIGFFNPTLAEGKGSLPGAEEEARNIKSLISNAKVHLNSAASVDALRSATQANIVHLSMHGHFNADSPTDSKLFFAGSKLDGRKDDSNALYAGDMSTIAALRDRDLVFAAACQTGLSTIDRTNASELIGIVRPLSANRNKNVILSLWNVDDLATALFVNAFYQQLLLTKDISSAFHTAQSAVRTKYPHPYYWAAFYLSRSY